MPPLEGDGAGVMFVGPPFVSLDELSFDWPETGGVEAGGGDVGDVVTEPVVWPAGGVAGALGAVVVVCAVDVGAIDGLFNP